MVKFSPLGTHFAVLFPKKIEIYSLTLKLLHTLTGPSRFNALLFARLPSEDGEVETEDKEVLCVGTEKGVVEVYEVELAEEPMVQDEDAEEDEDHEAGSSSKQSSAKVERIATLVGHTNRYVHRPTSIVQRPSSNVHRPTSIVQRPSSNVRLPMSSPDDHGDSYTDASTFAGSNRFHLCPM
jgi:hypothetical protein